MQKVDNTFLQALRHQTESNACSRRRHSSSIFDRQAVCLALVILRTIIVYSGAFEPKYVKQKISSQCISGFRETHNPNLIKLIGDESDRRSIANNSFTLWVNKVIWKTTLDQKTGKEGRVVSSFLYLSFQSIAFPHPNSVRIIRIGILVRVDGAAS